MTVCRLCAGVCCLLCAVYCHRWACVLSCAVLGLLGVCLFLEGSFSCFAKLAMCSKWSLPMCGCFDNTGLCVTPLALLQCKVSSRCTATSWPPKASALVTLCWLGHRPASAQATHWLSRCAANPVWPWMLGVCDHGQRFLNQFEGSLICRATAQHLLCFVLHAAYRV